MNNYYNTSYQIVMVGGGSVGKSALTIQFVQSHFIIEYDPTIEDSYRKQFTVDGVTYILDLLDTAGQEEYSAMRDHYMRTGDGFMCVYAINSRASLDELSIFIEQIKRIKEGCDYVDNQIPLLIVGNKADLNISERKITTQEGMDFARCHGTRFIETSAKTRFNVEEAFSEMVRIICKCYSKKSQNKTKIKKCSIL